METVQTHVPWNKGKLVGQKVPLVYTFPAHLQDAVKHAVANHLLPVV